MNINSSTKHIFEQAAWRGTRWLVLNASKYTYHEKLSAMLHLWFCSTKHSMSREFAAFTSLARNWFNEDQIRGILHFRGPHSLGIDISAYPLYYFTLNWLGLADGSAPAPVLKTIHRRVINNIRVVSRVSTLIDYHNMICGLRMNGYNITSLSLFKAAERLIPPDIDINPFRFSAVEYFNLCTHAILSETCFYSIKQPMLKQSMHLNWLQNFVSIKGVLDDVEYLSEYLASQIWLYGKSRRNESIRLAFSLLDSQSANGSWPSHSHATTYDRYHAAWRATEALHLTLTSLF